MTPVNPHTLAKSFSYALRGIGEAYRTEQSFRILLWAAFSVFILALFLDITRGEALVLVLITTFVLVLELLNTALEHVTDIAAPRIHHLAQTIKDVMAAAVLVASIGAALIGFMIFLPHILDLLQVR